MLTTRGLKPSIHNSLGLVSTGHSQLDELLGGGLQLGSLLLVASDLHSGYADSLVGYGLAEGLSMQQRCLVLAATPFAAEALLGALPYNRVLGDTSRSNGKSKSTYCCSYDLSRKLQGDVRENKGSSLHVRSFCGEQEGAVGAEEPPSHPSVLPLLQLQRALDAYLAAVREFVGEVDRSGGVGRVVLHGLHDILAWYSGGGGGAHAPAAALVQAAKGFVHALKMQCRSSKVCVVLSVLPDGMPGAVGSTASIGELGSNSTDGGASNSRGSHSMQPLLILADSAITVDSFAGKQSLVPYEFQEFCGFLVVDRVQHLGTLCAHRPRAFRFGLKRDRRKLHIEPLHLPPEESRAQGSAGTDARLEQRSRDRAERLRGEEQASPSALAPAPLPASASKNSKNSPLVPGPVVTEASEAEAGEAPTAGAAGSSAVATSASAGSNPPRQYKRLNLGGKSRVSGGGGAGGVSISTFRRAEVGSASGAAAPRARAPLEPGQGCGAGPGKDPNLEF